MAVPTQSPTLSWPNLRADELNTLAAKNAVVIVPIGSIEQHGPHLPTGVDATLVNTIAMRAAGRVAESTPVVVAPLVKFGLAEHHMEMGGTISLDFDAFRALVASVVRSIARGGFKRIFILNGHGGNIAALNIIAGELTQQLALPVCVGTYWLMAADEFGAILKRQTTVRHACEAETSMMLAAAPGHTAVEKWSQVWEARTAELRDIVGDGVYVWQSYGAKNPSGSIGHASAATSEKGEALLDAAARRLAEVIVSDGMWSIPLNRLARLD